MMKLMEQRIKDRACTICDGMVAFGTGVRATSKKRCDDCKDGSNWQFSLTDHSLGHGISQDFKMEGRSND